MSNSSHKVHVVVCRRSFIMIVAHNNSSNMSPKILIFVCCYVILLFSPHTKNNNAILLLNGVSGFSTITTTPYEQQHTVLLKRKTTVSTPTATKSQLQQRQRFLSSSSSSLLQAATAAAAASTAAQLVSGSSLNNDDLESFTVKELKQILKDNKLDKRGVLSKLRRKEDLINYLHQHLKDVDNIDVDNNNDYDDEDENYSVNENDNVNGETTDFTIENDEMVASDDDKNEADDDDNDNDNNNKEMKKKVLLSTSSEQDTKIKQITSPSSTTSTEGTTTTTTMPSLLLLSKEISFMIPQTLQERMTNRGITSLLPIQQQSFEGIYEGDDAILHSPTGSGKTLAFVLPLLSAKKRKRKWQRTKKVASPRIITICPSRELAKQVGKEYTKFAGGSGSGIGVATVFGGIPLERHVSLLKYKPQIVVATPGRLRELVREGHINYSQVATLVLDEADLLLDKSDSPDVFAIIDDIEKALEEQSQQQQQDSESESDTLGPEYQMVLVSATIGQNVRDFAQEMEFSSDAFIRVDGNNDSKTLVTNSNHHHLQQTTSTSINNKMVHLDDDDNNNNKNNNNYNAATVGHWHMSCKSSVRPDITANLVSVLSPRLTIVFVPTKSETESIAAFLSDKCSSGMKIRILHGDMSQSARSRCISLIREESLSSSSSSSSTTRQQQGQGQILVATDVASRGLDFPNVDLVVQYGLPKIAGKDGTVSPELYAHRTGRTGRYQIGGGASGNNHNNNNYRTSNAVAMYDPGIGEGKLISTLVEEVLETLDVKISPMAIPSSAQVVDAAYTRLSQDMIATICSDTVTTEKSSSLSLPPSPEDLAMYFRRQLESDERIETSDPNQLLDYLSTAMVSLSKLDPSISPFTQHSSLLTGDLNYNTLRLWYHCDVDNVDDASTTTTTTTSNSGPMLTPPMVIAFCKARGSGKLGRVVMCKDGSAVFDLPKKRARKLLDAVMIYNNSNSNMTSSSSSSSENENAKANGNGIFGVEERGCYNLEMISSLPEI